MPHTRIRRYLRHGMLPQLAVFEASVRLGSLTSAGDELHLAQPTVSTQMRKLSEAVGQPLVEHVGKRMRMTPAGEVVYDAGRDILAALARADEALAELAGLRSGRLRLAVGTTAKYLAMQLIEGFADRYPGVEVALAVHNHGGLVSRLAANDDDLYVFLDPPTSHEIVRQPILPNPLVAVARFDHPLARATGIAFERFAQEPFLMREAGSATRDIARSLFGSHGLSPKVRMELATNEAIAHAILAGLGVSIMSRHAVGWADDAARLATLDVTGLPLERSWQFVYPVGKRLPPSARAFMNFVRENAEAVVGARQ
jgi:LysR family transcriptional regulator, low CO2-responsive transcriptional regulator